jgi:predicted TIM-barrel fold metal-dependent hydrolase
MIGTHRVIDMHVHLAGPGDRYPEDLWWSEKFERGIGFSALKILKGWSFRRVTDDLMIETVKREARRAKRVDLAVVLALDRVYDVRGSSFGPERSAPGLNRTTFYVGNRLVTDLCRPGSKLLPGISVHPFRDDALEELEKYRDRAVLCKWLPSAQQIDLDDGNDMARLKLDRFYAKLAEIGLPLLVHTGVESSIPTTDSRYDRFNSPKYFERALDLGVALIIAHCGCSYFDLLQDNVVDETLRLFRKMKEEKRDWKLYADVSALFSPFRARKILDQVFGRKDGRDGIPPDRLIYGSDFPNPARGRRETLLRPFLRYRRARLLERGVRVADKWLASYFDQAASDRILTGFERLLVSIGQGGKLPAA